MRHARPCPRVRALRAAILSAALLVVPPTVLAAQQTSRAEELLANFSRHLEANRAELIDVRRDIHRNPEVSGQEERTAGIVAERLRAAGFEVRAGIGGHGVIGVLHGSSDGPLLAFRADMDAVRSNAPDPVDFQSEIEGVRHICGHDIHTTIGLALADGFAAVRDEMPGSVMMIFQPAEESASGARAMLADGAFSSDAPDAVFAYHTTPYEVGQIAAAPAVQMPGRDAVRVDVGGEGDLEAVAQAVRDVVSSAATLSPEQAFQPQTGEFVLAQGVGAARAGSGWRVNATFTTSSRAESGRARERIEAGLSELRGEGIELSLSYQERWIAGVTNTPELVRVANASAMAVLGETAVQTVGSMTPAFSEDFGSFQDEVPGVMYFLGVSNTEKGWVGMPHTAEYVADEESIFVGARAMAAVFFDLFERGVPNSGS
ncbi:MAG: amidohydrolase [Gemmatimonadota bacterium]|nr:amidohydrolase [Gemmatimonadota bacterium]